MVSRPGSAFAAMAPAGARETPLPMPTDCRAGTVLAEVLRGWLHWTARAS